MTPHPLTSPDPSRRRWLAASLAAGLLMGHVVDAIAAQAGEPSIGVVTALTFVVAMSAGTVCFLLELGGADVRRAASQHVHRWLAAIGAGVMLTLLPWPI